MTGVSVQCRCVRTNEFTILPFCGGIKVGSTPEGFRCSAVDLVFSNFTANDLTFPPCIMIMKSHNILIPQRETPGLPSPKYAQPNPITIRIGYEWKNAEREPKAIKPQDRYQFICRTILKVVNEVEKRQPKNKGAFPLAVRVGRMRFQHGVAIMPRLIELCETTDILAFDITGQNPNVFLELGMALYAKRLLPRQVYVFKQILDGEMPVPSDLSGYFITFYKALQENRTVQIAKLVDSNGFRAALRTLIIDLALSRGMWAERGVIHEDDQQDMANQENMND